MRFYILKTGFMKSCYADWRSKIVTDSTCKLCLCRNKSKISPFALFYVDFGPFFTGVFGVV